MKKILALVLALMLALGCFSAVAESAALSLGLPNVTLTETLELDEEAILNLLPAMGLGESELAIVKMILPLLNGMNVQAVLADNGLQLDVALNGTAPITLAGEMTENGIAVGSSLLSNTVLTVSMETIQSLIEQVTQQFTQMTQGENAIDFEALANSLMGYLETFVNEFQAALIPGEAEKGEFAFEGYDVVFNTKVPVELDVNAALAAITKLADSIKNDEAIASALASVNGSLDFDVPESLDMTAAYELYLITDDEGNQTAADTLVLGEGVVSGEQPTTIDVTVYTFDSGMELAVEIPEQDIALSADLGMGDSALYAYITLKAQGVAIGMTCDLSMGTDLQLVSALYFGDMKKPIAVDTTTLAMAGERTFAIGEGKAEITVESLMSGESGEAMEALQGDLMTGLMGWLQTLPEEASGLLALLGGGAAE